MPALDRLKSNFRPYWFIVAAFAVMLAASWKSWVSPIVDFSRESELPLRLLHGAVLYRDVHFTYTPFGPYFNAGLYYVFGPHLNTLVLAGVVSSILIAVICYQIARRFMTETNAALSTAFLIILCVFKPAANLIVPYSYSGLYAAVFGLASVLALLRFAETRSRRWLILTGIPIGFAVISKLEFGFAAVCAVSAYLVFLHRTNVARIAADLLITGTAALVIAAPVFIVLFATLDARMLIVDCHLFYTHLPASLVHYNRYRAGLEDPIASFIAMIGAAGVLGVFVSLLTLVSDKVGVLRRKAIVLLAFSLAIMALVLIFFFNTWDGSPLRAVPFLLAAAIIVEIVRRFRGGEPGEEDLRRHAVFIVAVYSLAIISRVALRVPSGGFAGSFFLPTSILLILYWWLEATPRFIGNRCGPDALRKASRIAAATLAIGTLVLVVSFTERYQRKFNYLLEARRGSYYNGRESTAVIDETLRFIEANTELNETIAILPEGLDFAFLTGRRTNLRHQVLFPDFLSEQDERDAIADLERDGVRYIFIPNRAMREFGKAEFGTDFYQILGGWIETNFELVRTFGVAEGQPAIVGQAPFWVKVYKKK